MSTELSVSPGVTVTICQKNADFGGYREFVYEYRNSYVEKIHSGTGSSRGLVLDTYQSLLNKSLQSVGRRHRFKRIVDKTEDGQNVFMSAEEEVPGLAAEEMATRFRWIGIDMVALRDNENIKMQSVFLNPT